MGKHFFEKRCHYSIRKFTIGAASVMIGASIFGTGMVQAAETEGPAETEGTVTQAQPLDKLPADIVAAIEKAGTTDKEAVVKAIKEVDFDGITGHLTYDEKNNPVKDVKIIKIVNGDYTFDSSISK